MPLGPSVSANLHELKQANQDRPKGKRRPHQQMVAIALSASRRAGGDAPPPPKTPTGAGQSGRTPTSVASRPPTFLGVGGAKGHRTRATPDRRAHPGFAAAQTRISKSQGISKDRAGAILAAGARKASKKAVKANPRLKKVSGAR